MLAFEVSVNGKRLCVASTAMHDALGVCISWARRRADHVYFNVGGLASDDAKEHTAWRPPALAIGDEVMIRVIGTDTFDQPDERYSPAPRNREE